MALGEILEEFLGRVTVNLNDFHLYTVCLRVDLWRLNVFIHAFISRPCIQIDKHPLPFSSAAPFFRSMRHDARLVGRVTELFSCN